MQFSHRGMFSFTILMALFFAFQNCGQIIPAKKNEAQNSSKQTDLGFESSAVIEAKPGDSLHLDVPDETLKKIGTGSGLSCAWQFIPDSGATKTLSVTTPYYVVASVSASASGKYVATCSRSGKKVEYIFFVVVASEALRATLNMVVGDVGLSVSDQTLSSAMAKCREKAGTTSKRISMLCQWNGQTLYSRAAIPLIAGVNASGTDSGHAASYAVDGNNATRWASNNDGKATWILVTFTNVEFITAMSVFWQYTDTYQVEVSTDGTEWSRISYGETDKTARDMPLTLETNQYGGWWAKYVRISPLADNVEQYMSIYNINFTVNE